MSNSAIIKIDGTPLCILTKWYGGFADIEGFARYARLRNFGAPEVDPSGITSLIQVMANCVGSGFGVEVMAYDEKGLPETDNGTFVLEGWEVVDIKGNRGSAHAMDDDMVERLVRIDGSQPEHLQLGAGFIRDLASRGTTFAGELAVGDVIWDRGEGAAPVRATVTGFGASGYPYVHVDADPSAVNGVPQAPDHYAREHFGKFLGNPTWYARIAELSHPQATDGEAAPAGDGAAAEPPASPAWVVEESVEASAAGEPYDVGPDIEVTGEEVDDAPFAQGVGAEGLGAHNGTDGIDELADELADEVTGEPADGLAGVAVADGLDGDLDGGLDGGLDGDLDDMGDLDVAADGDLYEDLFGALDEPPAEDAPATGLFADPQGTGPIPAGIPTIPFAASPKDDGAQGASESAMEEGLSDLIRRIDNPDEEDRRPEPFMTEPVTIGGETFRMTSETDSTGSIPVIGVPASSMPISDTGRLIVISMEAGEVPPDLSDAETAKNPLPYPDVMDAEFVPFDEAAGRGA